MTNKCTSEDIPQILNSINLQLKRIADSLEKTNQLATQDKPSKNVPNCNIRAMLEKLN